MAKIIVTTQYTKSINHVLNYVTYAAEKLEAQTVMVDQDNNLEEFNHLKYIEYIANRPNVIKDDLSGLFGINGGLNLESAKQQAFELKDHIWWLHIISLRREDAERIGFDNRSSWENLIKSKALDIAKLYNISLENLVVNCAYHDKAVNPHIHILMTSKNKNQGFIRGGNEALKHTSEKFKSMFFNEIFKYDVDILKQNKNQHERDLKQNIDRYIKNISHKTYNLDKDILTEFINLTNTIKSEKGKQVYGFMSPQTKTKVNDLLKLMVDKDKVLNRVYTEYINNHKAFVSQYISETDKINDKLNEFKTKFFTPNKNDNKEFHNQIINCCLQYINL